VDISGDAQLERKYGSRIPVLMADDELVCAYRLDRQRLQYWLDTERHPDPAGILPTTPEA
jgi:hypothetical protein